MAVPARVRRIIGAGTLGLGVLLLAACAPQIAPVRPAPSSAARIASPSAAPLPAAIWVLSPLGLNLRSQPDPNAAVLTTLSWGSKLRVLGSLPASASGPGWFQVSYAAAAQSGYVSSDPSLVTSLDVSQHVESTSGYSNLFPSDWGLEPGNPAVMATPPSQALGKSLLIQTAPTLAGLMSAPASASTVVRQESPVLVYGQTTYLTVYRLSSGDFEFVVRAQFSSMAMLFDFKQPAAAGSDTTLFKTLLASVIVP